MSNPIPNPSGCCVNPCTEPVSTNIPGPQGPNGINSYTVTTSAFTMPSVLGSVNVAVAVSSWIIPGQAVYIQGAGYFSVTSVNGLNVFVKNLGYLGNTTPNSSIGAGQLFGPAGTQGTALTLNAISPTTTLGDLIVDNGTNHPTASDVRLAVGTNGQVLTANSGDTNGLGWAAIDLTGANTTLSGPLPVSNGGTGATTASGLTNSALSNLLPTPSNSGTLLQWTSTQGWCPLTYTPTTDANQVLKINGAGNAVGWAWYGLLQHLVSTSSTPTTVTVGLGITSTSAPTTSNGVSVLAQAVTPTTITSTMRVKASIMLTTSASGSIIFITNGTTVLRCIPIGIVSVFTVSEFTHEFVPGSTTPITIHCYVGNGYNGAGYNTYVNSNAGTGGIFGATGFSEMTVEEYA